MRHANNDLELGPTTFLLDAENVPSIVTAKSYLTGASCTS